LVEDDLTPKSVDEVKKAFEEAEKKQDRKQER